MRSLYTNLILAYSLSHSLLGNSANPNNGYHGESLSCASCHNSYALNSGDGDVSISGLPDSYFPGNTYDLSLSVTGSHSVGYGFQLIPKANGSPSGSLSAVSSGMAIESNYAEHRGASTSGVWNFQWTAPATDEGTVTFYASGVATGGSRTNLGDYVYTTSQSLVAASSPTPSLAWEAATGGVIFSSPAVSADGTVYVGSNDDRLHAFDADGASKWSFTAGNWVDSTPAIGPDGTVYFGSWDNKVYALNPENGEKIWEYATNSYVIASPAIGADGRVYVGSKDSIFYAFEGNGSLAWEYFAGQPISSSAALGQDGTIYFGDENGTFHAVNPDGSLKWTFEVDEVEDANKSILSSPALDLSGNLYFGSGNGYCYSIADNEGNASLNWSFLTADRVDASPVLGIDDEVFFVSRDGYLRSLSTLTGNLNWDAFVGDVFYSSPVVDENGRAYVIGYTGGGENHLFAFDSNGSKAWDTNQSSISFSINGIVDSSPTISSGGRLFYGCYDGNLYCLDLGVGPADSDWPMFQRSPDRDGAWPSHLLQIVANDPLYGQVSGSGVYNPGSSVTITATPSAGYAFQHWSGPGILNPDSAATTVEMTSDRSLTAVFSPNSYEVTVTVSPSEVAEIQGTGSYLFGETATLSISSVQSGYEFGWWSGSLTSSDLPLVLNVDSDLSLTANFGQIAHILTVSSGPGGTASGSGHATYGTSREISAVPNEGYAFGEWTGEGIADPSSASTTVSMTEDRNVTANFSLRSHSLRIFSNGHGSVSGEGNYSYGDLAAISATPATGYSFGGWSEDGITVADSATTSVSMTQDRNLTALFEANAYSLLVSAGNGGTVAGSGNFSFGDEATIEATPAAGYSFLSWFGHEVADSDSPVTTVEVTENLSISAVFQINQYTLTTIPGSGGSITGGGSYDHGMVANLNAIPDADHLFLRWEGIGLADENASSTSILMDQNHEIRAVFGAKPVEERLLVLISSPSHAGLTSGSGSYEEGQTIDITATPSYGYSFSHWSGGDFLDPNSSSTQIFLDSDANLTAHFNLLSYSLKINASAGGSSTGGGTYPFGSEVSIAAIPEEGYHFAGWSGAGLANPLLAENVVELVSDSNLSVFFEINRYTLELSSDEAEGIVHGQGVFDHGSVVTISASPRQGYKFTGWSGIGVEAGSEKTMELVMEADLSIRANFEAMTLSGLAGVEDLGSNWYGSNWLGYFFFSDERWCYHTDLGWLYAVPMEDDSLWAWSPKLGWLWLSPLAFVDSLAWSRDDADWVYFSIDEYAPIRIFHYKSESWTDFEPNEAVSLEDSLF